MKHSLTWYVVGVVFVLFFLFSYLPNTRATAHINQEKDARMADQHDKITSNCRFVREEDLAAILGLPPQKFDNQMVYVVGYFQNNTRAMGYVAAEILLETEISAKKGDPLEVFRRVKVEENFIPPMNKGHIFLAKLDLVDLRCDVGAITPKVSIKKVTFK